MTLDATASDIVFDEIEARYMNDEDIVIARMTEQYTTNKLTLFDMAWNDDFIFTLTGAESGKFDLSIVCESDAPTTSPTTDPTTDPTPAPTTDPTPAPTTDPTPAPTIDPTPAPTP